MPDFLRFLDENERTLANAVPWSGDWPPPQRLMTVSLTPDLETMIAVIDPDGASGPDLNEFWHTRIFDQRSASQLPDDAVGEGSFLARGAEYVPEEGS